jgi:hypothetical protein
MQAFLSDLDQQIFQLLWSGLIQTVCPTASVLTQRWRSTTLGGVVLYYLYHMIQNTMLVL